LAQSYIFANSIYFKRLQILFHSKRNSYQFAAVYCFCCYPYYYYYYYYITTTTAAAAAAAAAAVANATAITANNTHIAIKFRLMREAKPY
jgi:hypothetical protein